jgi:hypothetical protein
MPFIGCEAESYRNYVMWRPMNLTRCRPESESCPEIYAIPSNGGNQPIAPSSEELEIQVQTELEGESFPEYNRLLNYLYEPENYPDPRITQKTVNEEKRACDRGTPLFENPSGNSPGPFTKKEELEFTVTNRPEGVEPTPVYLRWGKTDWRPSRPEFLGTPYLDDWGGWGWRHIAAKHGWSSLDLEETELALTAGTPQATSKKGKFVYEVPDATSGKGEVTCARRVVVDFDIGETEEVEDPAPRGIVTSFNVVK